MKRNVGKMCAQAGHAFLHAWWDAEHRFGIQAKPEIMYTRSVFYEYRGGNDARKIILITPTTDDLRRLVEKYRPITGVTLVEDCGYTVVEPGTITCAGIGPLRDEDKEDELASLSSLSLKVELPKRKYTIEEMTRPEDGSFSEAEGDWYR